MKLRKKSHNSKAEALKGLFLATYPEKSRFPEMDKLIEIVFSLIGEADNRHALQLGYWCNLMGPGHTTSLHTHEENEERYSGVCYLQVPKNSGDFVYLENNKRISITPRVGDLFLFPPSLPHEVKKNLSGQERLSVAFNIGPRH